MGRPSRVRVTGPLAPYGRGFREQLAGLGYSRSTSAALLQLMAQLSRWLADRGLDVGDLSSGGVERFLSYRAAGGYVERLSPRGLAPLLSYLRALGVLGEPAAPEQTAEERVLDEFAGYLVRERGLAAATVSQYRWIAALLSATRAAAAPGIDRVGLAGLSAAEVNAFVLAESERRSSGSLNNAVTALRALLRFLHLRGYTAGGLAEAVPRAPGWRRGGLRQALGADEVALLLAACDRRTAAGRRDYAILVVLARLGLRAGEVAAITLEDVDWRAGEILVRGKGNRRARLPLPVDVGRALGAYCRRGRPRRDSGSRALFLGVLAPHGAMSAAAVSEVVKRACGRAGLAPARAHRLRHTAATGMRQGGAPLSEIGQVLRHRRAATSALYAGVAPDELRPVARAWPAGRA